METCRLTQEQVDNLLLGQDVVVEYQVLEEYGRVATCEIELIPPGTEKG